MTAQFFDSDYVPHSLEEFYNSGWKEYCLYHIRRYSLNDVLNTPEDLLQDMMLAMARTKYIENYDPEITDFIKYIKTFIRNFMSKVYTKEHHTSNGPAIVNHLSLVSTLPDDMENNDVGTVCYEKIKGTSDFDNYVCLINSLEMDLADIKSESTVEYEGKTLERNPLTIYHLFMDGLDVKEIADIFGTSKQYIYGVRKSIYNLITSYN